MSTQLSIATSLRIGAVTYLNSRPLTRGLAEALPGAVVRFDHPSRLADDLSAGRLDVALIPSIEALRTPGCRIVSDACVASAGPVLSVKLYSRTPLAGIRLLALDEGSRTSAALVRILLRERYGVDPAVTSLPLGMEISAVTADAALLIGDRGMVAHDAHYAVVLDLGREWSDWTGLPMVFAAWTMRSQTVDSQRSPPARLQHPTATGADRCAAGNGSTDGISLAALSSALAAARDAGVANIDRIADEAAVDLGLPVDQCCTYLRDHLRFRLGSQERAGLRRYFELAMRHELAPAGGERVLDSLDC